jgi:hypothetical protein
MKTYDPANFIAYVFLDKQQGTCAPSASDAPPQRRLPGGYPNESSRTRLGISGRGRPRGPGRDRSPMADGPDRVGLRDALMALRAAPGGEQLLSSAGMSASSLDLR